MMDKKVDCSYVNGSQPDCMEADTEACETCSNNMANRQEISYYREIQKETH